MVSHAKSDSAINMLTTCIFPLNLSLLKLQPKISKAFSKISSQTTQSYHPTLNVLLILMEHSSFFCFPHPANPCFEQPTDDGNYNGHYWHGTCGKGFCSNFVWCWELFPEGHIFFSELKSEVVRMCVPFFSNNHMLLSSLLPPIQELSRFSEQQFKDHRFRSFSTPMRHEGKQIEKRGEEEKALLKTLLIYWREQQNLCFTWVQTVIDKDNSTNHMATL